MVEYGLAGALILILCIAAVMAIGGNLENVLQGFKSDMNKSINAANQATPAQTDGSIGDPREPPKQNGGE